MKRRLIVTGGSGYIGQRLVAMARAQGREVIELSRHGGNGKLAWNLGEALPHLPSCDEETALIHLAQDWKNQGNSSEEGALNIRGTETLYNRHARQAFRNLFSFLHSRRARTHRTFTAASNGEPSK